MSDQPTTAATPTTRELVLQVLAETPGICVQDVAANLAALGVVLPPAEVEGILKALDVDGLARVNVVVDDEPLWSTTLSSTTAHAGDQPTTTAASKPPRERVLRIVQATFGLSAAMVAEIDLDLTPEEALQELAGLAAAGQVTCTTDDRGAFLWWPANPAGRAASERATRNGSSALNPPLLRFFEWEHLPKHLQLISQPFGELARTLCVTLDPGPERTVALRKLLEAKDAAVRARVHPGG